MHVDRGQSTITFVTSGRKIWHLCPPRKPKPDGTYHEDPFYGEWAKKGKEVDTGFTDTIFSKMERRLPARRIVENPGNTGLLIPEAGSMSFIR